jgi:hypothetical protein
VREHSISNKVTQIVDNCIEGFEFEAVILQIIAVFSRILVANSLQLIGCLPNQFNQLGVTQNLDDAIASHDKKIISHQIYLVKTDLISLPLDRKEHDFCVE